MRIALEFGLERFAKAVNLAASTWRDKAVTGWPT